MLEVTEMSMFIHSTRTSAYYVAGPVLGNGIAFVTIVTKAKVVT